MRLHPVAIFALALAACDGPTAPAETAQPIDHGWQLTIVKDGPDEIALVSGVNTNYFTRLTIDDFDYIERSEVYNLASANDTVYVGYGTWGSIGADDGFRQNRVSWTLTGSMRPVRSDSTKIRIGGFASVYEVRTYDEQGSSLRQEQGQLSTASNNGDFFVEQTVNMGGFYWFDMATVTYRAVTCADFASTRVATSDGLDVRRDSIRVETRRLRLPGFTITCNPEAPNIRAEPRVKFTDYIRSQTSRS